MTPGLVDAHCHGHGGVDFATADAGSVRRALHALAERGVTRVVASLPTMPGPDLVAAVRRLAPLVRSGALAGLHLEGPFISPGRCGAQPASAVLAPGSDAGRALLARLLAAGSGGAGTARERAPAPQDGGPSPRRGVITAMTYAPELDGAPELEAALLEAGISPSPGHTDASAAQFARALRRLAGAPGPPAVTHLFNAMRGFHHRDPGPVPVAVAAAADGRLRLELIADGVHVHPAVVRDVLRLLPRTVCVVSDSSAATGAPPGRYRLGAVALERRQDTEGTKDTGPPVVAGTQILAAGAVGLERALANLLEWGVPEPDAVRAVTATPAAGLPPGRRDSGWVVWDAPGVPADVVLPVPGPDGD